MRSRLLAPGRTVTSIKRFMGRTFADLSVEEREETPYPLVPGERGEIETAETAGVRGWIMPLE